MALNDNQANALRHVTAIATGKPIDLSLRVTLNFHPDRVVNGIPTLVAIAHDDVYRSQFETGTSNGGLTAHPGGDRWTWESRIFGNAYDNALPAERPKYGGLNYKESQYGSSPRFGSSFFRLTADCLKRTTFCYPDSVFDPEAFGTAASMLLIELASKDSKDALDDYIEAQVHGNLRISEDVEALVLDPSYRGTAIETLAKKLPCRIEWHDGFVLTVDKMSSHPDYRGSEYVELGRAIAKNNILTPKIIGEAVLLGGYDLQALKKVWHYIARYGQS